MGGQERRIGLRPQAAFDDADGGQAAWITLGAGSEELRLSGFPDWYDEIQIVKVSRGSATGPRALSATISTGSKPR